MPTTDQTYILDEYITLDQIIRGFTLDVRTYLKRRQAPMIRELQRRGMTNTEIAKLLGWKHKTQISRMLKEANEK